MGSATHHPNTPEDTHERRNYRRQSTAYIDRPDIPIPCSSLGHRSYLREMQSSLTQEHSRVFRNTRQGPIIRLRKSSEPLISEHLNTFVEDSSNSKRPGGDKRNLFPLSKTPQPQSLQAPSPRSNAQPTSLQLALYGSFSSIPRPKKKVSSTSLPSLVPSPQKKQRLRRETVAGSHDVILRLSLPCRAGCCYCVYASLLGPVRVSFSRGDTPTRGRYLAGIKDGNGRAVIPSSRKADIRGLVYDPDNHSLHPPGLGERPMFRVSSRERKDKEKLGSQVLLEPGTVQRRHSDLVKPQYKRNYLKRKSVASAVSSPQNRPRPDSVHASSKSTQDVQ